MKTVILNLAGLHCETSAVQIYESLKRTKGVHQVEVDVMSRTACVKHDGGLCNPHDLDVAVRKVGFQICGFRNVQQTA